MNPVFHAYNHKTEMRYDASKQKFVPAVQDSLFGFALAGFESTAEQHYQQLPQQQRQQQQPTLRSRPSGQFYPVENVDEHKDMSLREILDITDDFLYDDVDVTVYSPMTSSSFLPPPVIVTPTVSHNVMTTNQSSMFNVNNNNMMMMPSTPEFGYSDYANSVFSSPESTAIQASSSSLTNSKKRSRNDLETDGDEEGGPRFRPYQSGQWYEKFAELCEYKKQNGHCLVPHTSSENLPLARWVKRQRYQYKLMRDDKPSTMTVERARSLEDIGFCWDSQSAAWDERLNELACFGNDFGHVNVPSNFAGNPQLATWVKCQRRQYKLHKEGKPSNITDERIAHLERLGFEWGLRSQKKPSEV